MESKNAKYKDIIGNISLIVVVVTIWLLLIIQMGINVFSGMP